MHGAAPGHSDRSVSFTCALEDHTGALATHHALPFTAHHAVRSPRATPRRAAASPHPEKALILLKILYLATGR
ncbi:hypothetical protein ACFV16_09630 [Streptomyces massasporeus]|uniref:hypothetical protein n=1 Tax=Streptomyces massasporeus TaxID=67324 RepID=UPI0036B45795